MPATIATLAAPGVAGLYYVDLDAVVEHPWTIPQDLLAEHRANLSDVSFGIMDSLRWKVHMPPPASPPRLGCICCHNPSVRDWKYCSAIPVHQLLLPPSELGEALHRQCPYRSVPR